MNINQLFEIGQKRGEEIRERQNEVAQKEAEGREIKPPPGMEVRQALKPGPVVTKVKSGVYLMNEVFQPIR